MKNHYSNKTIITVLATLLVGIFFISEVAYADRIYKPDPGPNREWESDREGPKGDDPIEFYDCITLGNETVCYWRPFWLGDGAPIELPLPLPPGNGLAKCVKSCFPNEPVPPGYECVPGPNGQWCLVRKRG